MRCNRILIDRVQTPHYPGQLKLVHFYFYFFLKSRDCEHSLPIARLFAASPPMKNRESFTLQSGLSNAGFLHQGQVYRATLVNPLSTSILTHHHTQKALDC